MTLTKQQVLIANGYLALEADAVDLKHLSQSREVVTVLSNFNYYGYMPSSQITERMLGLTPVDLVKFWRETETILRELTADNRQVGDFVVYQNFPKETLEMSKVEYWARQILMYFGVDKQYVTQPAAERPVLTEKMQLKVLHLAEADALTKVLNSLLNNKARWSDPQREQAKFLSGQLATFGMSQVAFRENGIQLINHLLDVGSSAKISIDDATDVLRLAALRSNSDVALREDVKFKSFSRKERRFFCNLLENTKHLDADVAERPDQWKMLFRRLHPGDFKPGRVTEVYDKLYQGQLKSFASQVESGISTKNSAVLSLLQKRPGDFTRRFHKLYDVFGDAVVEKFTPTMDKLTTFQLVKFVKYLETINSRETLTYPPRGNWSRLKVQPNEKTTIPAGVVASIRQQAASLVKDRLKKLVPEGFDVESRASLIKLQTNDQELASYGRGTVFELPKDVKFIRTASYWENGGGGTTWFDNGWNFFDTKWNSLGATCWNTESFGGAGKSKREAGAIFSGDPVNGKELKGRAAQLIDLYLDRLANLGVRYAVWNILCFSRVSFNKVTGEVMGLLQWGENPEAGKLIEPSRCQLVFPLKGDNLTKYIAYVDLEKRQLVYLDANLKGTVSSAASNGEKLTEQMPAFLEYLDSLPSVADLLGYAEKGKVPVVYSDKNREITEGQQAYVFRPENNKNKFKQVDVNKLLD